MKIIKENVQNRIHTIYIYLIFPFSFHNLPTNKGRRILLLFFGGRPIPVRSRRQKKDREHFPILTCDS